VSGEPLTLTRRQYLLAQASLRSTGLFLAIEAVATTALEHPEWDMDEQKTWVEWEAHR
jgi:hypothetical protein